MKNLQFSLKNNNLNMFSHILIFYSNLVKNNKSDQLYLKILNTAKK